MNGLRMQIIQDARGWIAYEHTTRHCGFGDSAAAAADDYLNECRVELDRLLELGVHGVAPALWATVPALQAALGIDT